MRVRRIGATTDFCPQTMRAGGDGKRFEQRTLGDLTGMAIEVIDAMLTGIEGVHDKTMVVEDLEAPGLGIVTGGRPAREFENIRNGFGYRLHLLDSEPAFGQGNEQPLPGIAVAAGPPGMGQLVAIGVEVIAPGRCTNRAAAEKDFQGFPIPAAAGLIASLTLFMLWLREDERSIGSWKYALPVLLIFLSFMMFSRVKYPSFKSLNWRTQRSLPAFLGLIILLAFTAMNYYWMPAVLFVGFLIYGFVRPFISKAIRKEIEAEPQDEPETPIS
jgi:hypothetical protein